MFETFFKVSRVKSPEQSAKVVSTILSGWRTGKSSTSIMNQLKAEGLSYRRINFLEDWRRAGHIQKINPAAVEKQYKALAYFDKVIEPYREQEGLTYKKALADLHKWEKNRETLVEKADKLAQMALKYGFDISP